VSGDLASAVPSAMDVEMLVVGDMIIDQDEGLTGIIQSTNVKVVAGFKVGYIKIYWLNLGKWSTPPELAQEALDNGDWIVQDDLTKAWGWTFPKGGRSE
jgi:hypothetical protein